MYWYEIVVLVLQDNENVYTLVTYYGPCVSHVLGAIERRHKLKLSRSHVHRAIAKRTKHTRGTKSAVLCQKVRRDVFKPSTLEVHFIDNDNENEKPTGDA